MAALGLLVIQFRPGPVPEPAPPPPPAPPPTTLAEAVAAHERTLAADPSDLRALQRLGIAYADRAAATGDPASYDLARQTFDRADAVQPDAVGTLVGRGRLALSLHDFAAAHDLGERAVAVEADHPGALGVLVDAKVELGRYTEAVELLERLLGVRPDVRALILAARVRELTGDLAGAAATLSQAAAAGSASALDEARAANLAGAIELRRGDIDAAAAHFSRADALEPSLPATIAGRARVLVAWGDLDGALGLLADAGGRPLTPSLAVLHADLLRSAGREPEAEQVDDAVRAAAAAARAAGKILDLELARFEADRGEDPALAVQLAGAAFSARPESVFSADVLAWALHRAGDTQAALPLVERALRLGGAAAGTRVRAAVILDAAGRPDHARLEVSAAFAESPVTAIGQRASAVDLATRLEVPVPDVWAGG